MLLSDLIELHPENLIFRNEHSSEIKYLNLLNARPHETSKIIAKEETLTNLEKRNKLYNLKGLKIDDHITCKNCEKKITLTNITFVCFNSYSSVNCFSPFLFYFFCFSLLFYVILILVVSGNIW